MRDQVNRQNVALREPARRLIIYEKAAVEEAVFGLAPWVQGAGGVDGTFRSNLQTIVDAVGAEEVVDSRVRARCNKSMLGRLQRTTRLDVGFALSFAGVAYLVWALVAGISRELVKQVIRSSSIRQLDLPVFTDVVRIFFVDAGIAIDIAGLVWLAASLVLVLLASRQRISISWAWLCAICQSMIAAVGSVVVGWATSVAYMVPPGSVESQPTAWQQVTGMSLPVAMALAVVVWVTFLVWLLVERARLDRHGPTLRDGLRTNIYR